MAPLLGIHPTEINSSLRELQYIYATVCFTVHREGLSTLTHIPLLWHKDRQGSSHSVSQITLVKAEVNKVWVHVSDWLDCRCCLHLPTFVLCSTKKHIHFQTVPGVNEGQTTPFFYSPSCLPPSCSSFVPFSPVLALSSFSINYPLSKHPTSLCVYPPATSHSSHTLMYVSVCLSECVYSALSQEYL